MYVVQEYLPAWAVEPKNHTGAAATKKWVNLKDYPGHLAIVIQTGAWAGGTAAVTVEQATDKDGDGNKALAFSRHYTDVTTSGVLAEVDTASDTFTLGTANKLYVIPIDPRTLDINNDFTHVSVAVASPGANADFYGVIYVLTDPRHAHSTPGTPFV